MRIAVLALFVLSFTLSVLSPAAAQPAEPRHAKVALFSPMGSTDGSVAAPGAIRIDLEPGWKTYWRFPGDVGLAPVFDWAGSENLRQADVEWQAPHRFTTLDLDNFGYEGSVILPVTFLLEDETKPLSLKLKAELLVCSDICVPETHEMSMTLPAGTADSPAAATEYYDVWFDATQSLPDKTTMTAGFDRPRIEVDGENRVWMTVKGWSEQAPSPKADLFIENKAGIVFGKPAFSYDAKTKKLSVRLQSHDTSSLVDHARKLAGTPMTLTYVNGGFAVEKTSFLLRPRALYDAEQAEIAAAKEAASVVTAGLLETFDFRILLVALLGGLILNLMPCVLPVLSLKILSVVSHGGKENRRTIFRNFMASALGILCSFWLMAGILSALKAAGETIGWGLQFQHPAFLVFLIVALVLFSVSMWGAFDIPLPRFIARNIPAKHEHEPTLLGHFLTGAFATLLATPCTAPFLGTAVGFALARGTFDIFAIFTFLGLGLALPYILLAVSPRLFRHMPKPGAWMVTLKKMLAGALLLTALWLVHVLYTVTTTPTLDGGWTKFDRALIAPAVAEGKTVVVDVTADWCLTCKANKRLVLEQDDIVAALEGENFLKLQADWTHRDEEIYAYLKSFGRYGIPFNVVYGPGAQDGIVLPELLTKKSVTDALAAAAGE